MPTAITNSYSLGRLGAGGVCEKSPQSPTKRALDLALKINSFFKQQSFGKQNLKVTEGGVVESAWIGVREIRFGPGFTRNAL